MIFKFDAILSATFEVDADTQTEAERILRDALDGSVDANFGAWPNGDPIIAQPAICGNVTAVDNECDKCGATCESLIGCPSGAEVCQECFEKRAT